MKSVNIAELKNRLSYYLRIVRKGEPLLVCDRDVVIARIEPAGALDKLPQDEEAHIAELERRGIARRPKVKMTKEFIHELRSNRPECKGDIVAAVLAEREEGW